MLICLKNDENVDERMVRGVLDLLGYTRDGARTNGAFIIADTNAKSYTLNALIEKEPPVYMIFSGTAFGMFLSIATLRNGTDQFTFRTVDTDVYAFGEQIQCEKNSLIFNTSKEWGDDEFSSTRPPTHKTTMDEILRGYSDGWEWNRIFSELYKRYYIMLDEESETSTI